MTSQSLSQNIHGDPLISKLFCRLHSISSYHFHHYLLTSEIEIEAKEEIKTPPNDCHACSNKPINCAAAAATNTDLLVQA